MRRCFEEDDAKWILEIHLPSVNVEDSWIWVPNSSGKFSVRSAYSFVVRKQPQVDLLMKRIWKLLRKSKIHPRLKLLWWQADWDILPVRIVVFERLGFGEKVCPLCGEEEEFSTHLFLFCRYIKPIWFMSTWSLRTEYLNCVTLRDFLKLTLLGDDSFEFSTEFLFFALAVLDTV